MPEPNPAVGPAKSRQALAGTTVLVVDHDPQVIDGLTRVFRLAGADVIQARHGEHVLQVIHGKSVTVALIDLDAPGAGLDLVHALRQQSPRSYLLCLTARASFDLAVSAWRAGAADVVPKTPDNVTLLLERVVALCRQARKRADRERFLADLLSIHEQFLQRMIDTARKAAMAEDKLNGTTTPAMPTVCQILVVDNNPQMAAGLQRALGSSQRYRVAGACSGGEALEIASSQSFQLALINDAISDLSAEMIADMMQDVQEDCTVFILQTPGDDTPGRVDLFERGHRAELIPELSDGGQLVNQIFTSWANATDKTQERRYLHAFRQDHDDFLRTYVRLRRKLVDLIDKAE